MAGSDAQAVFITADTNAVDAASVAAAARPNTAFTIDGTDTDGGVATFSQEESSPVRQPELAITVKP